MNIFRSLFITIVVVSFLELYVLIAVGNVLGAFPTIFLIIASAALGSFLLKQQGLATWQRFQTTMARQEVPAYELFEGFLILLGGALLLTPGFITDVVGLICLLPVLRQKIIAYAMKHYFVIPPQKNDNVLEGEFHKDVD
ncbi:MAG: FxsA family protein [Methylococcales bacterium]|nr:FxsA family protein [Methylococcales bacterium]